MQDAVAIAFETGAKWVCFLGDSAITGTKGTCGKWSKSRFFTLFTLSTINDLSLTRARPRVFVSETNLFV